MESSWCLEYMYSQCGVRYCVVGIRLGLPILFYLFRTCSFDLRLILQCGYQSRERDDLTSPQHPIRAE